ncbi:hypothetical protein CRV03_00990 [Arcobacter sp. F155]|nr:hypothetical protein CRV03_00990 [Arcobacter sp. F155]
MMRLQMKKILIISSLLFTFANANTNQSYDSALKSFKEGNYQKAYEILDSLAYEKSKNTLVNFYLGRSAYELGNYEYASSVYERILFNERNNAEVKIELAQTYLKMKLYEQALNEFKSVSNEDIPLNLKEVVNKKIKSLESTNKNSTLNTSLLFGIMYDSNVNSSSDSKTFDIYSPVLDTNITVDNNSKEQSATIFQVAVPILHRYRISDDFILNTTIVPLFMKYNNFKEKDLHVLSLNVSPTVYKSDYSYSLGVLYDLVYSGHEKYQSNYYLNPSYKKILSEDLLYTTSLKLGKVNYTGEKERSSNHYSFLNSLRYSSEQFGIFNFSLLLGKELRLYTERTDVSREFYSLSLQNSYNIFDDSILRTSISYKKTDYLDDDINYQSKRENKSYNYSVSLHKPISESLFLKVGGKIIDLNSNHDSYEYDKYILNTNLSYSF